MRYCPLSIFNSYIIWGISYIRAIFCCNDGVCGCNFVEANLNRYLKIQNSSAIRMNAEEFCIVLRSRLVVDYATFFDASLLTGKFTEVVELSTANFTIFVNND